MAPRKKNIQARRFKNDSQQPDLTDVHTSSSSDSSDEEDGIPEASNRLHNNVSEVEKTIKSISPLCDQLYEHLPPEEASSYLMDSIYKVQKEIDKKMEQRAINFNGGMAQANRPFTNGFCHCTRQGMEAYKPSHFDDNVSMYSQMPSMYRPLNSYYPSMMNSSMMNSNMMNPNMMSMRLGMGGYNQDDNVSMFSQMPPSRPFNSDYPNMMNPNMMSMRLGMGGYNQDDNVSMFSQMPPSRPYNSDYQGMKNLNKGQMRVAGNNFYDFDDNASMFSQMAPFMTENNHLRERKVLKENTSENVRNLNRRGQGDTRNLETLEMLKKEGMLDSLMNKEAMDAVFNENEAGPSGYIRDSQRQPVHNWLSANNVEGNVDVFKEPQLPRNKRMVSPRKLATSTKSGKSKQIATSFEGSHMNLKPMEEDYESSSSEDEGRHPRNSRKRPFSVISTNNPLRGRKVLKENTSESVRNLKRRGQGDTSSLDTLEKLKKKGMLHSLLSMYAMDVEGHQQPNENEAGPSGYIRDSQRQPVHNWPYANNVEGNVDVFKEPQLPRNKRMVSPRKLASSTKSGKPKQIATSFERSHMNLKPMEEDYESSSSEDEGRRPRNSRKRPFSAISTNQRAKENKNVKAVVVPTAKNNISRSGRIIKTSKQYWSASQPLGNVSSSSERGQSSGVSKKNLLHPASSSNEKISKVKNGKDSVFDGDALAACMLARRMRMDEKNKGDDGKLAGPSADSGSPSSSGLHSTSSTSTTARIEKNGIPNSDRVLRSAKQSRLLF